MNYSLGILKPDCLIRNLQDEILSIIKQAGLTIVATKRIRFTEYDVAIVYHNCVEEDFWLGLVHSFLVGDSMAFVVYGSDAIELLNDLVGFYEPSKAKQHTIRYRFGKDVRYNVIHSTASESSFWREISHFFAKDEISSILKPIINDNHSIF